MIELQGKLYVTIDTEPDCDVNWNRSSPLTFKNIIVGIPTLLRPIWDELHINPIYFVSPEILSSPEACEALKEEIHKGAIIGTHLHSEYIHPHITIHNPAGKPSLEYPCYAHSTSIETQKIINLTDEINKKLGVTPIWYRAARFGADLDTIKILAELGYKYDSSVTPCVNWTSQGGPDHSKSPLQPYYISRSSLYEESKKDDSLGIVEVPLTISKKRFGFLGKFLPVNWLFYNWLRPTHMFFLEQKLLIDKMFKQYDEPTLVMMFHSMEVMPKLSPYVRNKWQQRRFIKVLRKTIQYYQKKAKQ